LLEFLLLPSEKVFGECLPWLWSQVRFPEINSENYGIAQSQWGTH